MGFTDSQSGTSKVPMRLSIIVLITSVSSVAGQGLRDWLPTPLQHVFTQKSNLVSSEGLSDASQWSSPVIPDGLVSVVSRPIAAASSAASWLFGSQKFTEYDTSDSHDVELSNSLVQKLSNKEINNTNGDSSWTAQISDIAKDGRQYFSATNALTLAYETGEHSLRSHVVHLTSSFLA